MGEAERWLVKHTELEVGEHIGSGSFSDIYKCQWRGLTIAVKRHKIGDKVAMTDLIREVDVLHTTRHPNIVMFLGAAQSPNGELMMLLEYIEGSTLFKWVLERRRSFAEKLNVAFQLSQVVNFLQ